MHHKKTKYSKKLKPGNGLVAFYDLQHANRADPGSSTTQHVSSTGYFQHEVSNRFEYWNSDRIRSWYDTIRWRIFTCAQKLVNSQLNLLHGTKQKKTNEETENKNQDAQKKRSSHKAVESVLRPEGSLWQRFVKKGRSWAGSERERDLWMVRVESWESKKMW